MALTKGYETGGGVGKTSRTVRTAGTKTASSSKSVAGAIGNALGNAVYTKMPSQVKAAMTAGTTTKAAASTGSASSSSSGGSSGGGSSGRSYSSGYGSGSSSGSSGGSGGGSSTGGSGTVPSAGVDAGTGGGQWLQSAGDLFANNPAAMLSVLLQDQYGPTAGNGLYGMLEPYADAANALFMAQGGGNAANGTTDSFLNYLQDYWDTLQTPGRRLDTGAALANIWNAPADSPLQAYLSTGDPNSQANRTLGLIRSAMQTGYNPLYAQAVMDRLNREQMNYVGNAARGTATGPFIDYLKSVIPDYQATFM